jgi:hypothetical protein
MIAAGMPSGLRTARSFVVFLVQARAYLGDERLRVGQDAGGRQSDCCLS